MTRAALRRFPPPVKTYAHQLRHACGYYLANKGCDLRLIQDYLGHSHVETTMVYTHVVKDLRRPAKSPLDML